MRVNTLAPALNPRRLPMRGGGGFGAPRKFRTRSRTSRHCRAGRNAIRVPNRHRHCRARDGRRRTIHRHPARLGRHRSSRRFRRARRRPPPARCALAAAIFPVATAVAGVLPAKPPGPAPSPSRPRRPAWPPAYPPPCPCARAPLATHAANAVAATAVNLGSATRARAVPAFASVDFVPVLPFVGSGRTLRRWCVRAPSFCASCCWVGQHCNESISAIPGVSMRRTSRGIDRIPLRVSARPWNLRKTLELEGLRT